MEKRIQRDQTNTAQIGVRTADEVPRIIFRKINGEICILANFDFVAAELTEPDATELSMTFRHHVVRVKGKKLGSLVELIASCHLLELTESSPMQLVEGQTIILTIDIIPFSEA